MASQATRCWPMLAPLFVLGILGCENQPRVIEPEAGPRSPLASHTPGSDPGDGELDPSFGTVGFVLTDLAGGHDGGSGGSGSSPMGSS